MLLEQLQRHISGAPEHQPQPPPVKFTDNFLTTLVVTQDNIAEDGQHRNRGDYVHVSNLLNFCARRQVLCVKDKIQQLSVPRSANRIVWEMGRAAERHVRNQIIASLNYKGVVGNWRCFCGRLDYGGFYVADRVCARCGSPAQHYHEFELADDDARIVGHPDLLIYYAGSILVIEIKSMNKKDFEELKAAKPDHIFQGAAYRRLLLLRKSIQVLSTVATLYVCKDYVWKGLPYKEYYPDVTQGQWPSVLDLSWQKAYAVKAALKDKQLPPRIDACPSSDSVTARGCIACTNCFARKS